MIGRKLRLLREFRNYSQEYLAEKLGITQNAYSRIENDQTRITTDRLAKLATILNVPSTELLSDKEPVLQFSDSTSLPQQSPLSEGHWKEMLEDHRRLYGQVINSKDEKISHLENEIHFLRKERDRIMHLVERLTTQRLGMPVSS
jgi:transcriptional regulator with XRE-family HTH domain